MLIGLFLMFSATVLLVHILDHSIAKSANQELKACSRDPVITHCAGQLIDPRVNFASVHGLTPATVHVSFCCPEATSRGELPFVKHRVTRLAEVIFLHVKRTQKVPRGKSNLAHAHY